MAGIDAIKMAEILLEADTLVISCNCKAGTCARGKYKNFCICRKNNKTCKPEDGCICGEGKEGCSNREISKSKENDTEPLELDGNDPDRNVIRGRKRSILSGRGRCRGRDLGLYRQPAKSRQQTKSRQPMNAQAFDTNEFINPVGSSILNDNYQRSLGANDDPDCEVTQSVQRGKQKGSSKAAKARGRGRGKGSSRPVNSKFKKLDSILLPSAGSDFIQATRAHHMHTKSLVESLDRRELEEWCFRLATKLPESETMLNNIRVRTGPTTSNYVGQSSQNPSVEVEQNANTIENPKPLQNGGQQDEISDVMSQIGKASTSIVAGNPVPDDSPPPPAPLYPMVCICGNCRPMETEQENVCCMHFDCVTRSPLFMLECILPAFLVISMRLRHEGGIGTLHTVILHYGNMGIWARDVG